MQEKKIKGRKRHLLVDCLGLVIKAIVHSASISEHKGAAMLLISVKSRLENIILIWVDSGYSAKKFILFVKNVFKITIEVIRRPTGTKGFKILQRRWVVERTFGWINKFRRLSKDYEVKTGNSESFIYMAMISIMARRLARNNKALCES